MSYRVGLGFDTHRLAEGRKLVLGGVEIPYERGLEGHSDGDVLLHALADALLGAVAAPDIGSLFPPGDERWRGAPSHIFVERAVQTVQERGYRVVQVDSVLLVERPRLAGYFSAMRSNIARWLGVRPGQVGLKAKTAEGMGSIGRAEGMAAQAVALVVREKKD